MTKNDLQKRIIQALATAPAAALERLATDPTLTDDDRATVARIAKSLYNKEVTKNEI